MCFGTIMVFLKVLVLLLTGASVIASPLISVRRNEPNLLNLAEPAAAGSAGAQIYRLPNDVIPTEYELQIVPNLAPDFTFTGIVHILVKVTNPEGIDEIRLHCDSLDIQEVRVNFYPTSNPFETEPTVNQKEQLLIIKIKKVKLTTSNVYKVSIRFSGIIRDDMTGLYRSQYKEGDSVKWLAATQFEATYARRVFPCFDEPALKAPFTLYIARTQSQVAISNIPLDQPPTDTSAFPAAPERVWDKFQKSPKMPTYLLAFVVSDKFESISSANGLIKVWAKKEMVSEGSYILGKSETFLNEMESFTRVKYNLPKMDLVALPDMGASAMENWGLTTYKEKYVLCDEKYSAQRSLEAVTQTVAHEFAHQWFGNYITMAWWDYLWLNEGFATYFEYYLTDKVEPTWRFKERFVVDVLQPALSADSEAKHSLTTSVKSTSEINTLFDLITYDKAASILRMLEHMMSATSFKTALETYLNNGYSSGGSVTPDNFYESLETQFRTDNIQLPPNTRITDVMKKWVENKGYPLVEVKRVKDTETCTVSQVKYITPPTAEKQSEEKWFIPISYTTQVKKEFENTKPVAWLLPENDLVIEEKIHSNQWILLNLQQIGFYRVNYELENWKLLTSQLKNDLKEIHVLNRAQLIDDAFTLAEDTKLSYSVPLELVKYLKKEIDMVPWSSALKHFRNLYHRYQHTSVEEKLRKYLLDIIRVQYTRLGGFTELEFEDRIIQNERPVLVALACRLGLPECLKSAAEEYKKNKDTLNKISSNLKTDVFCYALNQAENAKPVWDNLWTFYHKTKSEDEKNMALLSLGCTKDEQLLKEYLAMLLVTGSEALRKQDHVYVLKAVSSLPTGVTAALNFIEDKVQDLTINDHDVKVLKSIVNSVSVKSHTDGQVEKFKKLHQDVAVLKQDKYGSLTASLKQASDDAIKEKKLMTDKAAVLWIHVDDAISADTPPVKPDEKTNPGSTEIPRTKSSSTLITPSTLSYIVLISITVWKCLLCA